MKTDKCTVIGSKSLVTIEALGTKVMKTTKYSYYTAKIGFKRNFS